MGMFKDIGASPRNLGLATMKETIKDNVKTITINLEDFNEDIINPGTFYCRVKLPVMEIDTLEVKFDSELKAILQSLDTEVYAVSFEGESTEYEAFDPLEIRVFGSNIKNTNGNIKLVFGNDVATIGVYEFVQIQIPRFGSFVGDAVTITSFNSVGTPEEILPFVPQSGGGE